MAYIIYRHTILVLAFLFVLVVYFIFSHIDIQQTQLIESVLRQKEHYRALNQMSAYLDDLLFSASITELRETFVILILLFGAFFTVLALMIRKLKNMTEKIRSYALRVRHANRKLRQEVRERKKLSAELILANRKQKHIAFYDSLTDLPNRRLCHDRLIMHLAYAKRMGQYLALFFLDLDGFKHINDTLGHEQGDQLLKIVAARLKKDVREMDTVARLGGDEFTIIFTQLEKKKGLTKLAERILMTLSEPIQLGGMELFITASIGIAVYPNDGEDDVSLIKNADLAMYNAKEKGRNNYQFYNEEMQVRSEKSLTLISDLHRALKEKEFILEYQPQINVKKGLIVGMEALVRWNHSQYGIIPPNEFIHLAEQSGLIHKLGDEVLEQACEQYMDWRRKGAGQVKLSVNLSAQQLYDGKIVERISEVLSKTNMEAQCLILELTEGTLARNLRKVSNIFKELKTLGVMIAIDDFGSEYSSLSYLTQFPIDVIKIDRSFINNIEKDQNKMKIVKAMIALAESLGLLIIAEGVETANQKEKLLELNCPLMQGYLIGRPSSGEKWEKEWFVRKS